MSLIVGSLCIGQINAWLSLAVSRKSLTLPSGSGTNIKPLYHSDVSLWSRGIIIFLFCSLSNLSLNGFCNAYAIHLDSAWYGLAPSLTCNEKVPLKYPMPAKHQWIHHELPLLFQYLSSYLHSFPVLQWSSSLCIFAINYWNNIWILFVQDISSILCPLISLMFPLHSTVLHFAHRITGFSMSGIPKNARLSPGTTKNLHRLSLFLCLIVTWYTHNYILLQYVVCR